MNCQFVPDSGRLALSTARLVPEKLNGVAKPMRRLIRSAGFNVEDFATAEESLVSNRQTLPSCVILIAHLPLLNRLEHQRRLQVEGRNIRVVVITANADEKVRQRAFEAGAIAFLPKPFEELTLLQAVSQVVK